MLNVKEKNTKESRGQCTYKYITALCIILMFIAFTVKSSIVWADVGKMDIVNYSYEMYGIPKDASVYAQENYNTYVETMKLYHIIDEVDIDECYLGYGYVKINADEFCNDEIYYYPVIHNNDIIMEISIIGTPDGWSVNAGKEDKEVLNIDLCREGMYAIVIKGGEKCAVKLDTEGCATIKNFIGKYYTINTVDKVHENVKETYTPGFSEKFENRATLKLYNMKGQSKYGMCWAASVATIVNYIKGKNYSASYICTMAGIGLSQGANINKKKEVLADYGVTYKKRTRQLRWNEILINIQAKKPIAVSAFTSKNEGHSLTIYGYVNARGKIQIVLWDSALNEGSGYFKVIGYNEKETSYVLDGKRFVWEETLSKK